MHKMMDAWTSLDDYGGFDLLGYGLGINGDLYIYILVDNVNLYLFTKVSQYDLNEFLSGEVDLLSAIEKGSDWITLDIDTNEVKGKYVSFHDIESEYLPESGYFVNLSKSKEMGA